MCSSDLFPSHDIMDDGEDGKGGKGGKGDDGKGGKDPKTGFDPISEAQKAVRDKIDQITYSETVKAMGEGTILSPDELEKRIDEAIKNEFNKANISETIINSATESLKSQFSDFDKNEAKFEEAVKAEVFVEKGKFLKSEDFNFTEFSKTVNDSLQTAKDYENNLNANRKGLS